MSLNPLVSSSPVSRDTLPALLAEIDAYGDTHSLSPRDLFAVKMTLDELATNLLQHGAVPGVQPRLWMSLELDDRSMRFVVRDNGRRFDPTGVPSAGPLAPTDGPLPVGGLGLTLLRGFVRKLAYRYADGWNELRVEYDRGAAAPS